MIGFEKETYLSKINCGEIYKYVGRINLGKFLGYSKGMLLLAGVTFYPDKKKEGCRVVYRFEIALESVPRVYKYASFKYLGVKK